MPREASELERALGRLLTAIQSEETRAINSPEWAPTHATLARAEGLYWAAKRRTLGQALGEESPRSYLGLAWLARHPRVLPAVQELELQMQDFKRQA
ncbi:MAG TPA: hypothetical protein VKG05_03350 [Steroidobacteraceae bacterium]|nr:hypothetical protein [Steroidobacteraceae bacterium]